VFVEVSGMLKAHAASLSKICSDLRLMSSGPDAGLGEIRLPARQAGSSIMPGKVNPVVPEAVTQCAMLVFAYDAAIGAACAAGILELNPFLPLVAMCLLDSIDLEARACGILRRLCVEGIEASEKRCAAHIASSTAVATALVEAIGYEQVCRLVSESRESGKGIEEAVVHGGVLSREQFHVLIGPEAVCRLGSRGGTPHGN